MKKNILNKFYIIILLVIAILFVTFFSTSTSPLYGTGDYDSCGYILMGMELANGRVPYLTISDNKGPVLWIIEGVGQLIVEGKTGVYLTQCLFAFLCLVLLSKSLKELFDLSFKQQIICCLIYLIGIAGLYAGGNLTEEYSLFFIILSLYMTALFINKRISYYLAGLVITISAMCVVFIRINDCLSIIFMWILVFSTSFNKNNANKFKNFRNYFLGSICGLIIVTMPILIYYGLHHAIYNIVFDYFLIGMGYAKDNVAVTEGIVERMVLLFSTEFGFVLLASFIYIIITLFMCTNTGFKNKKLVITLILGINISCILAAIVKPTGYDHYLMPITLSYVLANALLFITYMNMEAVLNKFKDILIILFAFAFILINFTLISQMYKQAIYIIRYQIRYSYNERVDKCYNELAEAIPEEDKNKGLVFKSPKWYLVTNTRPYIKYIWTDTLKYNKSELDKYVDSLSESHPEWIVVTNAQELEMLGTKAYNFFVNNYELKKENVVAKLYVYSNDKNNSK